MNPQQTQPSVSPDDAKFNSILQAHQYTPPVSQSGAQDWYSQIKTNSQPQKTNYVSDVVNNIGNTFSQGGKDVVNDIGNTSNLAKQAGNSPLAKVASVGATAGHVAGDIAGTAGGIIGSFISPLLPDSVKNTVGDVTKYVSDKVNSIPGMTPEIAKGLSDLFNTSSLETGAKSEIPVSNAVKSGIESVTPLLKDTGEAIAKGTNNTVSKVGDIAGSIKEGFHPTLSPNEAAGQIVQGGTEDIQSSKRALSSLDTRGVKTYTDLQNRINQEIKPLAQKVDAELLKNPQKGQTIKSFEQTIGQGKSMVKVNYIKQGIDDLKNYFTKTNDAQGLSKIKSIENKAKTTGMSYKEINDLARLHGSSINAFNASGEAASGLSKQAAENTRSGLKAIARQGLGGTEAKALDAKLSDLYDTKTLIDKQVEKVNSLTQKTPKKGIIPKTLNKIVSTGVKVADTVTGNPLKAIGKEIGLSGGQSSMSAIEIEKNLAKNLKLLRSK